MIKDIIVSLAQGGTRDPACEYAVSAAEAFQAQLAGIAFAYEPIIVAGEMTAIPPELVEEQLERNGRAAEASLARFEEAARRAGISFERHTSTEAPGGAAYLFGEMAKVADLVIVGQPDPENDTYQDLIIETALFETGRPAIVVPYIQKEPFKLDRVMVCWDGSRTAARAVADAMPLLERAKAIDVVTVFEHPPADQRIPGADMAAHLARHGVKVNLEKIITDIDAGGALLSFAADNAVDFMVMGAYGHSRLREFILGGVTRDILETMTVPVLMSH